MRLCGYARVSTREQADEGVSLAAQRERITAWCRAYGHELVMLEEDAGVSGTVPGDERPGMRKVLAAVRGGRVDGVVAMKLDRFTRSTLEALNLAGEAQRVGWTLVSVQESLDTSTAMGRFVLTILAAIAQLERDRIAERTVEAMDHLARIGKARSRFVPFGFRLRDNPMALEVPRGCDGDLVEHADEQGILFTVASLRGDGMGPAKIARCLNGGGTVNPRTGRAWTAGTMFNVVRTMERRHERERAMQRPGG